MKKYLMIAAAVLALGSASPVQAMTKEHLSRNAEIRKELAVDSPINSLYLAIDESEYLADGKSEKRIGDRIFATAGPMCRWR